MKKKRYVPTFAEWCNERGWIANTGMLAYDIYRRKVLGLPK